MNWEYSQNEKGKKMTKYELARVIANKLDITIVRAEMMLTAFCDAITESLKNGERVELRGFGNFSFRNTKAHSRVMPLTGILTKIPAKRAPKFKASPKLKAAIQ